MTSSNTENDLLRKTYQDYWRGYREHTQSSLWPRIGEYPPVPDALSGLTCGAKTRAGTPCKRVDLYQSGRCKFHGGLSTGPKTEKGKAQARENGKLGGRGHVRKPNPTETLPKPLVEVAGTVPNFTSLADETSLGHRPMVRCRDCANVSAASSCLIEASGQAFPMMGELRSCAYFHQLV